MHALLLLVACAEAQPVVEPAAEEPVDKTVEIPVPYTNVSTCHDSLKAKAPGLWTAFEGELVPLARGEGQPWERLEPVLDLADAQWATYLHGGGSPRAMQSPWRCSVGDLGGALVQASVSQLAEVPAAERTATLDHLTQVVDARLSDAPNALMMRLAIQGAR